MKEYKIKVLKDTPFDKAGTELSISDFRIKYNYICTNDVSNSKLIAYLKNEWELQNSYYSDSTIANWFEVIEVPTYNFGMGSWVWHEELKQAFCVMPFSNDRKWRPNYVSFEAANSYTGTYKRKATQEEIDYYDLVSYCDGDVLIGRYKCYYHINTWKELVGVQRNVATYIIAIKNLSNINYLVQDSSEISNEFKCTFNGLKVGCKTVSHDDVIKIAKQLKIIA